MYAHACLGAYIYIYICWYRSIVCIHMETREQPEVSFLLNCHLASFKTGSLMGLELSRLDNQKAWKIFLSLLLWDYKHILLWLPKKKKTWVLKDEGLNLGPYVWETITYTLSYHLSSGSSIKTRFYDDLVQPFIKARFDLIGNWTSIIRIWTI